MERESARTYNVLCIINKCRVMLEIVLVVSVMFVGRFFEKMYSFRSICDRMGFWDILWTRGNISFHVWNICLGWHKNNIVKKCLGWMFCRPQRMLYITSPPTLSSLSVLYLVFATNGVTSSIILLAPWCKTKCVAYHEIALSFGLKPVNFYFLFIFLVLYISVIQKN